MPANRSVSSPSAPELAALALDDPEVLDAPHLVALVVGQREERAVEGDLGRVGAQRLHLLLDVGRPVDRGAEVLVGGDERRQRAVGVHPLEGRGVAGLAQRAQARAHPALRHRAPVDLGDLPRLAEVEAVRRHRGQLRGVHRDPVGLDVVGVAVAAELVVGDQHLRLDLADHADQVVGRLGEVGVPEGVVVDGVRGDRVAVLVPLHPGVAVGLEAAQPAVVGDAERLHRVGDLAASVLAEPVLLVGGEVLQLGDQDLAHLTGGAGDQGDPAALGDVAGHRGALADRLVVGVGVDEEQLRRSGRSVTRPA